MTRLLDNTQSVKVGYRAHIMAQYGQRELYIYSQTYTNTKSVYASYSAVPSFSTYRFILTVGECVCLLRYVL